MEIVVTEVELHDVVVVRAADEEDTVHGGREVGRRHRDGRSRVLWDDIRERGERAFDEAAREVEVFVLEADLVERTGNGDVRRHVGRERAQEFLERLAGDDELHGRELFVKGVGLDGKSVRVRAGERQRLAVEVEADARENGAAVVCGAGEDGLAEQRAQHGVRERELEVARDAVDAGVVAGVHGAQRVVGVAGLDVRRAAFLVKGKTDAVIGETADDFLEIPPGKDDLAGRVEFDGDFFDDADLVVRGLDFEGSFFRFQKDAGEDGRLGF